MKTQWFRSLLLGGLMVLVAGVLFLMIVNRGATLHAPDGGPGTGFLGAGGTAQVDSLFHVLLALVVVIVVARAVGSLFQYLHQPPVVGEILAGLLLGPSLLGRLVPSVSAYLLPTSVAPLLEVLAQVGVILYMFLVGLELDPGLLKESGPSTTLVSNSSVVTPFVLGSALSLLLYPRFSSADVPFTIFALFLGVSMSITAFPVLARILTDRRIHKSKMGVMALTCAAANDVVGWCMLALVVSLVQARAYGGIVTTALAAGYIVLMFLVVRPAMVRLTLVYGNRGRLTQGLMATVSVALLASSLATHFIGVHAVFGAFVLGAVIPHDSGLARELTDKLEDLVVVLLLPSFFAITGMRTQIGLVQSAEQWFFCGLIVLVASVGKIGGSVVAARLTGLSWRDSAALGTLMNTRGLMELIVLNIGLDLKVLSPLLFAMMVLMALLTTLTTAPILHFITRKQKPEEAVPLVKPSQIQMRQSGILVPISNPQGMSALLDLADAATRAGDPRPRVLALVRRPAGGVRSGLREMDRRVAPRAPILVAAMDHARAKDIALDLQAVWSDDPATDILRVAAEPKIGWLLIGHHRPVFGGDLLGGVVRQIIDGMVQMPVHVGVVIHGHQRPLERVIALVDNSADGRAALDLAMRISQKRQATMHAVLVPKEGAEPEPALGELIKSAGSSAERWLHTDVLTQRSPAQMAQVTRGDLVVMGMGLVDQLGLPLDDEPGAERCVVVVRGGLGPGGTSVPADRMMAE